MSASWLFRMLFAGGMLCFAAAGSAQTTVSVVSRHAVDQAFLETLTFATGAYTMVRSGDGGRLETVVVEITTRWEGPNDKLRVVKFSVGTDASKQGVALGFLTLAGSYYKCFGDLLEARVPRLDESIETTINRVHVLCFIKQGEPTVSYNGVPLVMPPLYRDSLPAPVYSLRAQVKSVEKSPRLVTPARPGGKFGPEVPPTEFAIPGNTFRIVTVSYEIDSDFLKAAPQETLYAHRFAMRTKSGELVQPVANLDKRTPYPRFHQITTTGWFHYEPKNGLFKGETVLAFIDSEQLDDGEAVLATAPRVP